ncbi:MAG TPA: exopolysaccharide biosynthesis polyprenyl glycosylphosphotransferase [Baekduia sp.]|jgi:exopolysaccharide biosynthesis polyprenyl glycosylphosphotransferase
MRGARAVEAALIAIVRWPHLAAAPAVVAFLVAATQAAATLALVSALATALAIRHARGPAAHLPVLRVLYPVLVPVAVLAPVVALSVLGPIAGLGADGWALVLLATAAVTVLAEGARRVSSSPRPVRFAFVGDATAAGRLAEDLRRARVRTCVLVGRIGAAGETDAGGAVPAIGELGHLRHALTSERAALVVLGGGVARLDVFDELAESCLDLPIQLTELADFYEDVFGHVPTAEINAAWFAQLVEAGAHRPSPRAKRTLDLALAVLLGVVTLPLMAIVALLVRLDGGPAIFAQRRIGEAGRPFCLYKLRTMRVGSGDAAAWAQENDPRATRVGRVLRRWHVDELPQLWNVLLGEMSFVGPRPEQLEFVERLELALPFYRRRHLTRPGLTGWAQVRCGYAGSEVGAAWKLCNDLYYVKHRSLGLDLLVLAETAGLLVFRSTTGVEPQQTAWAGAWMPPEPEIVARAGALEAAAMELSRAGEGESGSGPVS